MQSLLDFLKSTKGKAFIIAAISGGVMYFFPGSVDTIVEISDTILEIVGGVSDKIQPEVVHPNQEE